MKPEMIKCNIANLDFIDFQLDKYKIRRIKVIKQFKFNMISTKIYIYTEVRGIEFLPTFSCDV